MGDCSRCRICSNPHRNQIESWKFIEGKTLLEIVDLCKSELDFDTSVRSLSIHFNKHTEIMDTALKEYHAEILQNNRKGVEAFKGDLHALDVIIQKGFKNVEQANIRDAMKAIELKNKITGGKNLYAMIDSDEKYQLVIQAIQEVLPDDMKKALFENIADKVKALEEANREEEETILAEENAHTLTQYEF